MCWLISSYYNSIYKSLVSKDISMTTVTDYGLDNRSFSCGQTGSKFNLEPIAMVYGRKKLLTNKPGHSD